MDDALSGCVDGNPRAEKLNRVVALAVLVWVGSAPVWAQPVLKVISDPQPARVGRPYHITCEVSWSGGPKDYTVLPAEVETVEWATVSVAVARAEVRDGVNVIAYTVILTPTKEGTFQTPAITIMYLSPEDVKPPEQPDSPMHPAGPDAHPRLRADPFPLPVQPHTTPAWLSGALGAFLISVVIGVLAVGWWYWRHRIATTTSEPVGMPRNSVAARESLQNAKRKRIEGDYYGFYCALLRAMEHMAPNDTQALSALRVRADEAGYRGIRPSEDVLDADERAVERLFAGTELSG